MAKLQKTQRPPMPAERLGPSDIKVGEVYLMYESGANGAGNPVMCVNNYRFDGPAVVYLSEPSLGEVVVIERDDVGVTFVEVDRPRIVYSLKQGG